MKLADNLCNLSGILEAPPNWDRARKQAYFDWDREVVDRLRGTNQGLEAELDARYARRGDLVDGHENPPDA